MHSNHGPVSLADISVRQGISLSYLEQLFSRMRRNKLVISTRGPGGGYQLDGPPDQVCIADVINAVDEAMQVSTGSPMANGQVCLTEQLWAELSGEIERYLTTISLADMMENEEVKSLSRSHDLRQDSRKLL